MISLTSPIETAAHAWPAAAKMAGLLAATVALFVIDSPLALGLICLGVLALYLLPGQAFFRAGLRQLWILWPFVLIVGLWHLWIAAPGAGAAIIFRMIAAVGLANLVTMTTRLTDMIDVVAVLTRPLRRVGLNGRILDIAIALVIRLIPVLTDRGRQLTEAWRARSSQPPHWRIILPFTVLALDDADHVADALRARGGFNTPEES